jgi:hypothetical protein
MAALQSGIEPAEDDWGAASVVRCLRTRRLTLVRDMPAGAEKEDVAMARKASPGAAAGRCPAVE